MLVCFSNASHFSCHCVLCKEGEQDFFFIYLFSFIFYYYFLFFCDGFDQQCKLKFIPLFICKGF